MKQSFVKYLKTLFVAFALVSLVACAATATQRSAGEVTDDAAITTKVNAAFAADPLVKAYQINVDTYRNVVTLSGGVNDRATVTKAGELARGVGGVKAVKNNLTVK